MTVQPAVEAVDVTVSDHHGRRILDRVTLSIAAGERVLIVGPSGSGKSTLLRAVAGVPPSGDLCFTGSLRVAGSEVLGRSMTQAPRDTGWLPQDPAAAVCLPVVEDDVAFPCENRAVPPDRIGGLVTAALDRVAAASLRTADTATLSDGQAQRVGLAVATAAEPSVLVLDEPTSMLDPHSVHAVHTAVLALRGAAPWHDPTLLLVEHRLDDLAGAVTFAGLPARTVLLVDGKIVADGETRAVLFGQADLLHRTGCWLPWQAEAAVALTTPSFAWLSGGIADSAVRQLAGAGIEQPTAGAIAPGAGEQLLTTTCVAVGYTVPLIAGVNVTLRRGELVALVGANGSGKSTLLRTLAGLQQPLQGTVSSPGGRPGLVFQNPEHQFVAPTVRQEIGWGGFSDSLVTAALRRHRLEHLAHLAPFRLSGGEKRRLSLAAMLIGDRQLLLADEPMFGLDQRDTREVQRALRKAADDDRAVLFSCHDLRVVAELAGRLLVVAEGRLIADGPTLPLLRDPALRRAAGLRLPPLLEALFEQLDDPATRCALAALADPVASGWMGGDTAC